jgi:hypothetical protein
MTRIFMNSDITRCKPFDINRRVFTYCDNLHESSLAEVMAHGPEQGFTAALYPEQTSAL